MNSKATTIVKSPKGAEKMKELEATMTEEMNHVTVSETLVSNLKPACKRSCVEADDDTIASRVALRKTRKKFDENMQVIISSHLSFRDVANLFVSATA